MATVGVSMAVMVTAFWALLPMQQARCLLRRGWLGNDPPYNLHCGSCGNCCMVYKRKSQDLQGIRSLLYLLGSLRYVDDRCYF